MSILSTPVRSSGTPQDVTLAQTRLRAGPLLEQGAAFAQVEAPALRERTGHGPAGAAVAACEERFDAIVIGGGQAGLSVGYQLARLGLSFVILDAGRRVGDSWRARWDSLRLFTPARFSGLEGMPFPAAPRSFPTKDEMADYLERYAREFALPVRCGVRVDELTRDAQGYLVRAGAARYRADHVVIAAASYQKPKIPAFAAALDPAIVQLHSSEYRNPRQLAPGGVLLVGAGNSGAELAIDLAATHRVWLSGRHPGHLPVKHDSAFAYHVVVPLVFRVVFHRLLGVDTPLGRKAKPHFLDHSGPLIRVKPADLDRAGVVRVARLAGAREGRPVLEDGQRPDVANVIWCTGFRPGLEWVKLPVCDDAGRPRQYRGVVEGEPGLYVAGLAFQHSPSSGMIHGVARDARWVAEAIAERMAMAPVRASEAAGADGRTRRPQKEAKDAKGIRFKI